MKHIETVGNLKVYGNNCYGCELFVDAPAFTITVLNGSDVVARETYFDKPTRGSVNRAVESLMRNRFDIVTINDIVAGVVNFKEECDGELISGNIAGFSGLEYFKHIDDTRFYKHYTHRPMMKGETK